VASATWRELIKRIWEVDPLLCPQCGTERAKIAVIKDPLVMSQILRHVHLWEEPPARRPSPGGISVLIRQISAIWRKKYFRFFLFRRFSFF